VGDEQKDYSTVREEMFLSKGQKVLVSIDGFVPADLSFKLDTEQDPLTLSGICVMRVKSCFFIISMSLKI